MKPNNNPPSVQGITKGELKFWLVIIGMIVSFAVTFNTLQNQVNAMQEKGSKLRAEYEGTNGVLKEVRDSQIRMEKDVEFIKRELNNK